MNFNRLTSFGRALASRCKDMLSWAENEMIRAVGINRRYRVVGYDRGGGDVVEGAGPGGYTLPRRGGRVVECGGLENRYVGNPGVGGSNPPLSALWR
jgi:hypothetical protein